MDIRNFVMFGSFVTLLGTPIIAAVFYRVSSQQNSVFRFRSIVTAAGFILIVAIATRFKLSLSTFVANTLIIYLSYLCFGFLAFSTFRIRPKVLGIVLGSLCSIPLIGGVLLGTVGALLVMFIVGDSIPIYEGHLENNIKCQVTSFGNATSSKNGYDVILKKHIPFVSFVEYEVRSVHFETKNQDPETPESTCLQVSNLERF